jgi:hypothetical protein
VLDRLFPTEKYKIADQYGLGLRTSFGIRFLFDSGGYELPFRTFLCTVCGAQWKACIPSSVL